MHLGLERNSSLLVSSHANIYYLTGFKGLAENEREAWVLVVQGPTPDDQKRYLITDGRYFEKIKHRSDVIPKLLSSDSPLRKILASILESEGKKTRLECEADNLTHDEFTKLSEYLSPLGIELVPTTGKIASQREIKSPSELDKIKKACHVTDECFEEIIQTIHLGQTEQEVASRIEFWLRSKNYDLAFYPIVAVDENAAIPHYDSRSDGQKTVEKNSIILIDFGAKVDDYCADMTRMISIGSPSSDFQKAYETLLGAQNRAIAHLAKETEYKNIDIFARSAVENAGYPSYQHSTGHGLGLEIHEGPRVSTHATDTKRPGHVVTIEPGIYLEGKFGIRIEDTVAIREDGSAEILTKTSKELVIIQ